MNIKLKASLHDGQKEVINDSARFKVLACGRRWGKSKLAAFCCLVEALKGGVSWWVAPSFPIASIGWRTIKKMSKDIPGIEAREGERSITFPGGGWLQVKSADNVDSLRGEGLNFVVMDEAAFMKREAWTEAIRPALADKQGQALFCSTPNGANWFHEVYTESAEGWKSWSFKTTDNPHIPPSEVEAAKASLPERVYEQEFEAKFLTDGQGVFRNYRNCIKGSFEQPMLGEGYLMSVDLARTVDYTVITVWSQSRRHLVHLDRFNQVDWAIQQRRIIETAKKYNNAHLIIDATGVGDPVTQTLQRSGLSVQGVKITAQLKRQMVESLMLQLENEEISFPDHPELIHELSVYSAEQSAMGVKYNAPSGQHDDIVISMALATNHFRNGFIKQRSL